MTKKQLRAELEKAHNEIGRLQVTNANLLKQRSDLIDQLQKPLETLNNQPVLLYQELGNNIYNVLKTKSIDSMSENERENLNLMLVRFCDMSREILKETTETERERIINLIKDAYYLC